MCVGGGGLQQGWKMCVCRGGGLQQGWKMCVGGGGGGSSARLEDVCVWGGGGLQQGWKMCVAGGGVFSKAGRWGGGGEGVFSKAEMCLKEGVGVAGGLQQGWRSEVLECVPLWRTFSVSVFICSTTHCVQNDSKCPKGFCSK